MIDEKVICAGFGGQGVMLLGQLMAYAANEKGLNTLWYPSYGPETRGGTANCSITISEKPVNSPVISKADTIIVLNKPSLDKFEGKVKPGEDCLLILRSLMQKPQEQISRSILYSLTKSGKIGNFKVANIW